MGGMKLRLPIAFACFLAFTLCRPAVHVQLPSAEQRFAMAVEMCKKAIADDTPSRCELYGKIQVVDSFPDVKVQKVDAFADIKVQWVEVFADSPGKWQKVDSSPDYKVQFVEAFADYKVEFVDAFPGCE